MKGGVLWSLILVVIHHVCRSNQSCVDCEGLRNTSANDIFVSDSPREVVMAIVNGDENGHKMRAQHGRLLQFH